MELLIDRNRSASTLLSQLGLLLHWNWIQSSKTVISGESIQLVD
jgi:hypothetical protein